MQRGCLYQDIMLVSVLEYRVPTRVTRTTSHAYRSIIIARLIWFLELL